MIEEEQTLPVQETETEAVAAEAPQETPEGEEIVADPASMEESIEIQVTENPVVEETLATPHQQESVGVKVEEQPLSVEEEVVAEEESPQTLYEATAALNVEAGKDTTVQSEAAKPIIPQQHSEKTKPVIKTTQATLENPLEEVHLTEEAPSDGPMILIDSDEAESLLQSLQQTANNTQVGGPVGDRVSTQILEALKTTNSELAKQIQGTQGRAPGQKPAAIQARPHNYQPLNSDKSEQTNQPRGADPHLEKLKAKVMEQIRVKIRIFNLKNRGEIQIKLTPRLLGDIKIRLQMDEAQARGTFVVENNSVKELLQRSMPELQRALADHGIDADSVDVIVADEFQNEAEGGKAFASLEDQEAAREWIGSFRRIDGDEEAEEITSEGEEDSDQVLNVVV